MNELPRSCDAIVIGARCAGAAEAMLLARKGLRVLAVERSAYGTDTLSTHALMRAGVLQLRRWGVLDRVVEMGTPAIRRVTFHYGDERRPVQIKARDGVDALYAPRRTILDAALVDAARDYGAHVRHAVRLLDLLRDRDGRVIGATLETSSGDRVRVEAPIVIGADGVRSDVAGLVSPHPYTEGRASAAFVYGYWSGLALEGYEWFYRPGVSAGAIPTNGGETCVFVSVPTSRFRRELRGDIVAGYHRILSEAAPSLVPAIATARRAGPYRAWAGRVGFLRPCVGPGWALVGDAGYFRDPITAHGITDALRDAELLARAVLDGSDAALAAYQSQRDALSVSLLAASDALAAYEWDLAEAERLHRAVHEAMAREAEVLARLAA